MLSNQLTSIINAEFIGQNKAINIEYLLTDSRSLLFPEKSIFFALKTPSGNGHLYIDELIEKGVRVFVVSQDYEMDAQKLNIAAFFKVESPLKALQQLSAYKRQQSDARVIGITGSNGKTMVKEWLYALL
jgi:alanine racemase